MVSAAMALTELDQLPANLLERPAAALHRELSGPTLIHLPGRQTEPLFVSVLQHGNEVTGWEALRRLLKQHADRPLPRALSILIGNVDAARQGLRRLDHQPDFNRCWPGGDSEDNVVGKMFRDVTERMRQRQPIASVDVHNNTGLNPHYAAINRLDPRFFRLAARFSSTVIYFTIPRGVQSSAFAEFCPSVTLECGQAGEVHGTDHTLSFLEACLYAEPPADAPLDSGEIGLYRMVATVYITADTSFSFDGNASLSLRPDLDRLNFRLLPRGTAFGGQDGGDDTSLPVVALDEDGNEVTERYFESRDGFLLTRRPLMPAMLTLDERVIRQDCLCYVMERIAPDQLQRVDDIAAELPEAADEA